jgi:hypothetical protein
MDEEKLMQYGFVVGFIVGVIVIITFWILSAEQVEISKVRAGYLTLKNKTYTVTLYDTLDAPEKDKE